MGFKNLVDDVKTDFNRNKREIKESLNGAREFFGEEVKEARRDLKDWRHNLTSRWIPTVVVTSLVGFCGLGVGYLVTHPPDHRPPSSETYERMEGIFDYNSYLLDHDGDGDVDLIHNGRYTSWVAPDMVEALKESSHFYVDFAGQKTPRMTPEMQALATQILHAQRGLSYLVDSERYKRFVGER